jgi:PAS domain S-box-containing protein
MQDLVPLPRPEDIGLGRLLFELVPEAITVIDVEAERMVLANPAAEDLFGYASGVLVTQAVTALVPPGARQRVARYLERLRAGDAQVVEGTVIAREILCASGEIRQVEMTTTLFEAAATGRLYLLIVNRDVTERYRMEAALRESEARFRALVEHAYDVITLIDAHGRALYHSPSIERLLGYSPAELLGTDLFTLLPGEAIPELRSAFAELLRTPGAQLSREVQLRHRGGEWRTFEAHGTNLLDDQAVQAVVINSRDITQWRHIEAALRESELRSRQLADAAFEAVIIHQHGQIREANRAAAELFGYEPQELLGRSPLDMAAAESRATIRQRIRSGSEETYVAIGLRKDGTRFRGELRSRRIIYRGQPGRVTAIREVTDRPGMPSARAG